MHVFPRSLAARLTLGTVLLAALGLGFMTWHDVHLLGERLVGEKVLSADQLTGSITSATWLAMQADRKDDAYAVMAAIGAKHGVASIRLHDPTGRVVFETGAPPPGKVDLDSPACQACHEVDPPHVTLEPARRARFYEGPDGHRRLAMVTAFYNEPACSGELCHPPPEQRRILGILDLALDLREADGQIRDLRTRSILLTLLVVVLLTGFLAFFHHRFVRAPIRRLVAGTLAVGRMEPGEPVPVEGRSELTYLAEAFNAMQARLRDALAENARFTQSLERAVEQKRRELEVAQQALIRSDRLASLGQLAASVAHEVNNPISGVVNLSAFLQRILTEDGIPPGGSRPSGATSARSRRRRPAPVGS